MYIGPWQEYRLSKQRTLPREAVPILAASAQADLQNALLKTLDPVAAQAAMRVMQSYLASSASTNFSGGSIIDQLTIPIDEAPARHRTRPTVTKQHLQNNNPGLRLPLSDPQYKEYFSDVSGGEPKAYKFQQPNSERKFLPLRNTAREVLSLNNNNNQPLSVRSTKSEPVRNLPSLLRISNASARPQPGLTLSSYEPRTITLPVTSKEPSVDSYRPKKSGYEPGQQSYDQSALVSFLRIEREQRARAAELRQQALNFHQSVETKLQEAPMKKVDPLALQREKKLQQVEQMKQLYLSKGPPPSLKLDGGEDDAYASNKSLAHATSSIDGIQGASPQRPTQPPPLAGHARPVPQQYKSSFEADITPTATSRLEDITEITDEHLMRVSKYFSSSLDGPNVIQMPSVVLEPPSTSLPAKDEGDEHEQQMIFDDDDDYMSISLHDHMLVKNNSMDDLPPSQEGGGFSGSRSSNVDSSPDLMIITTVDLDHYKDSFDEVMVDQDCQMLVEDSLKVQEDQPGEVEGGEGMKEVTIIEDLHLTSGGLDSLLRWSASLDRNDMNDA